jgi:hypothetical protein
VDRGGYLYCKKKRLEKILKIFTAFPGAFTYSDLSTAITDFVNWWFEAACEKQVKDEVMKFNEKYGSVDRAKSEAMRLNSLSSIFQEKDQKKKMKLLENNFTRW